MAHRVTMPALGESVTEGTVTRWLKGVGDEVAVDEPLLEVSTDKVDTEIPSPVAGTLQEILVGEDETAAVGADLAVIGDGAAGGGGAGAAPGEAGQADTGQAEAAESQAAESQAAETDAAESDAPATQDDGTPAIPSTEQPVAPETSEPETSQPETSDADQPATPPETAPAAPAATGDTGGQTVTMPALGESVTEGTVTRWLKKEGDQVAVDEPLLEVSTDKVDTEIPSPVAGVLTRILVGEDETAAVGADLAVIGGEGSAADDGSAAGSAASSDSDAAPAPTTPPAAPPAPPAPPAPDAPAPAPSAPPAPPAPGPAPPAPAPASPQPAAPESAPTAGETSEEAGDESQAGDGVYVTPLVRKLAQQHGVDLRAVAGTGVGGRIRKQDVLDAAEAAKAAASAAAPAPSAGDSPAAAPAASAASTPPGGRPAAPAGGPGAAKRGTTEKMSRLRKVIAHRMVESLQVSAQLTTVVEVDLTKVARLRARSKSAFEAREGVGLSYLPFLALAAVEALKAHPMVNASIDGEQVTYHGHEHLSIAVDTERGLLVPVVKNAGDLNIAGLARAIADVAERTRNSTITPDDLSGGTFTITNTGSRGALFDTPIINQPQVAILGTGALVKRPVVVTDADGGETIAIRSMMYLALSYDHRIVDGADAARFLATMKARLEEGNFEADLGL